LLLRAPPCLRGRPSRMNSSSARHEPGFRSRSGERPRALQRGCTSATSSGSYLDATDRPPSRAFH
jgi:hypothetical protein